MFLTAENTEFTQSLTEKSYDYLKNAMRLNNGYYSRLCEPLRFSLCVLCG
jgi:hypothetical protein